MSSENSTFASSSDETDDFNMFLDFILAKVLPEDACL